MFKISKKNVIESDEGFSVEVIGRTGIKYSEINKSINIDSEILAGPSGIVLYKDSIKSWNFPDNDIIIDENKRMKMICNIREAFKYRGVQIQII